MSLLSSESLHAIIMIGIPGAGKSTFAEHFADTFKALLVSQTSLQRKYNLSPSAAKDLQDNILSQYLKTQRTILIDGGYDSKEDRDYFVRDLVKAGYRPLLVWVQTDTTESSRRATKPYPKGSGMSVEEFEARIATFDPPSEKEKAVVISGKHTYPSQLKIVLRQLTIVDSSQPHVKPTVPPKPFRAEYIPVKKGPVRKKHSTRPDTYTR